jgi:dihydrofolate synthase/folylpolyglutamate synthase
LININKGSFNSSGIKDLDSYDETINYLYALQKHGIKLGLSNTNRLMQILGEPHKSFRSIHISGTNGKGSTATAIASILNASGLKTGLFTSPHLISFTERISINDQRISEDEIVNLTSKIRKLISNIDINPTFFEFVTALAFYYFSMNNVEWAVIETGMGGRLDATNIIKPDITIITNISLDHCEFLGNSITDITYEKAGIIKQETPLLTSSLDSEVISQLTGIANMHDVEMHLYDRDFRGSINKIDAAGISFNYSGDSNLRDLFVPLSGEYQLYNMCLAIRACEILKKKGLSISERTIISGLQNIRLEGRLEQLSDDPPIIIDGAHNPAAAVSLSNTVKTVFPDKNIILIVGIMNDKNISGILSPLIDTAESVILTKARYDRAATPDKMEEIISDIAKSGKIHDRSKIINTDSVGEALNLAKSICNENSIILICGSFYTTGEAKELLGYKGVLSRLREQ